MKTVNLIHLSLACTAIPGFHHVPVITGQIIPACSNMSMREQG